MMAGRGGSGKSTVAAALAASVTGGPLMHANVEKPRCRGSVLWFGAEESAPKTVTPRLRAAGARMAKVIYPGLDDEGQVQHAIEFPADLHHVRDMCGDLNVKLCIVDPLASYCPGIDLNQQQPVRQLLGAMRLVAEQIGFSWLLIAHPNKSRTGPILDRIFASAALVHVCRSVLLVGEHPAADGRRVVVHAKTNEGEYMPTVCFRLNIDPEKKLPPTVSWIGEVPVTKEMLGVEAMDAGECDQHLDARALLRGSLTEWRPAKEIIAEAAAAGIGERSLRTAKAELQIPSRRVANGLTNPHWEWGPPPGGWKTEEVQ